MITWAMVLETAIKWLIPMLCAAIVGYIGMKIFKPIKRDNQVQQQAAWDQCMLNSSIPQQMCNQQYEEIKKESMKADKEIIEKIDKLVSTIDTQNEQAEKYHKKVDQKMELIQEGVLDAHLQNLIGTCETYIKRGYITATELDAYQSRYNLYKKLGGNGHMEPWDNAIKRLPHEPLQKHTSTTPIVNTPPITRK